MSSSVATVLGIISSIAVIVFLYVKVLPQKYNGKLENKYLQWMHNYFNFKKLYLVHFTGLSGRHSVLERPLYEVNGRPFFSQKTTA